MTASKKVLIVNPSARGDYLIAPYLWLCLKSHYQQFGKHSNSWEWLDPIYHIDYLKFDVLLNVILESKPDVVGFSMFLWNERLNHQLAKEIKKNLPKTLIIFGGPHLTHRYNPKWFQENSAIDLICNPEGYGEEFMSTLLDALAENSLDLAKIPNAIYPSGDRSQWVKSELLTEKRKFEWPSSLVAGSEKYLKDLSAMAIFTKKKLFFAWESLRGCPYGCVYCEWGGGIMSKMNIKPMEIVERELNFLRELDVHTLHINDPNFGILKRDLDVAASLVELAHQNKLQRVWFGGKNKNNKTIVEKVDRMLLDSGLSQDGYQVSVNALNPKQLKAIKRTNLSIDEHIEMVNRIRANYDIDADFELILGLPESNLDSVFEEYDIYERADLWTTERFPWALLPETPAAHPDYIKQYKIKTVQAGAQIDDNFVQANAVEHTYNLLRDPKYVSNYDVVIETSSYTADEWVEMLLVDNFVRAIECSQFTTKIRKHLKTRGVPASEFFRRIWQQVGSHPAVEDMRREVQCFVRGEPGMQHSYLWFRSRYDSSRRQLKMEACFNLMVLKEPEAFYGAFLRAFEDRPDICGPDFLFMISVASSSVVRGNALDICTQVMSPKFLDA